MKLPQLDLQWPGLPASVGALSTLRSGGVSAPPYDDGDGGGGLNLGTHVGDAPDAVARNRALLRAGLPAEPAWLTQVHGTTVVDAARVRGAPPADASIAAHVDIGLIPQGFGIGVQMTISLPGLDRAVAQDLIDTAHQVCPYSNATRGNIEVVLTLA